MDYFAQGYGMDEMGHGYGDNVWGWLLMAVMMTLVVLGVILLVRFASGNQSEANKSNALDVLKHRYAKGEITKKQFDEIKKDIK